MVIYSSVDKFLQNCLGEAKKIVEEEALGYEIPEKIYLTNTKRGNREYQKATGKLPNFYTGLAGDEFGRVETHGGKYFIFLHDTLVLNLVYEDIVSTLIHEILHIVFSQEDEKGISKMETDLCKRRGIKRENLLRWI